MSHLRTRLLPLLAALAALLALVAAPSALAKRGSGHARHHALAGDRNRDRIPDRWERRHHLSLRVSQARRDQDHDGLRNRAEFLAGTDPRDADTDGDGVEDGGEHAGTVKSFDGTTLVVQLYGGGELSGVVNGDTELECHVASTTAPATARAASTSDDGPGDDSAADEPGDDDAASGDDDAAGDDHGDDTEQHDVGDDDGCDGSALTPGTTVKEAELEASGTGAVWHEVELLAAPAAP